MTAAGPVRDGQGLRAAAAIAPLRITAALALVLAMAGALWLLPLLHLAPNRLLTGRPIDAGSALGALAPTLSALALLAGLSIGLSRRRAAAILASLLLLAALLVLAGGLGMAAKALIADQPPAARARLASGAVALAILLALGLVIALRLARRRWLGWLASLALVGGCLGLGAAGWFDALSLVVEYRARRDQLASAVLGHLGLSLGGLAVAILVTLSLAPWTALRRAIDIAVDGVQVVPAVALLGALVAAMSGLLALAPALREAGLGALGPAPAIIGIAAYLLLPLWRGLAAAMRAPDPATLDAARALGLTPFGIVRDLRLPLGAPILVGALRVAAVQSIGLATLGALVGAGGLGLIVFEGMAQFASDLILLGAIPIVVLSLAADSGLGLVETRLRHGLRR